MDAATRRDGSALLVAGHGAEASHLTLGQIGEALLATGAAWTIRRLHATTDRVDRATLKRSIDELVADDAEVAVLVVLGSVISLPIGPALVAGDAYREYPEDATVSLAWIGERLRAARASKICTIISVTTDEDSRDTAAWLAPLGSARHDLLAVEASAERALATAFLDGLCGEALDPATGTITAKSLRAHFARAVPDALIASGTESITLATSPPLDRMSRLWDLRRSEIMRRRVPVVGDDDLSGAILPGRFRLDEKLARGTFGTVYRARQLSVDRDVAVKVIHADIDPASDDFRLFVHEIRAVGRMDHPNVVRIHHADITHDGRLFFAMSLLPGRDLQTLAAAEGQLSCERAIEITRELLAGLGAAHEAGLVHADVKPANAIVGPERAVLVDFGLARLRPAGREGSVESVGGTPTFMAPEQLGEGRVDARSDLFSAALVLVFLTTGWRRTNSRALAPPDAALATLPDELRAVLARALAIDPAKRYQTALEFSDALTGKQTSSVAAPAAPRQPFRHLLPLVDHVYGRERDLDALVDHVLGGRSVIYTAPSGTGKTSLLRAGLVPRLTAAGISVAYHACRIGDDHDVAIAKLDARVVIIDQAEHALATLPPLAVDRAYVIGIREDHLSRAIEKLATVPVLRLPPLGAAGARAAITTPLAEARIAIEPALVDALLADLQREGPGIYPPHLQLACTVLCDSLAPDEATLTVAHYRGLGGFDAIVGEYLDRVLDDLVDGRAAIARDLLVALVTTTHERAMRLEDELVEIVGAKHTATRVASVLESLRERGLLVRSTSGGDAQWELAHDSLVPRVLAWIDRQDLARRRAVELVRYHVRRSRPGDPSLLGRGELREVAPYAAAIDELDAEWRARDHEPGTPSPRALVARSRAVIRNRRLAAGALVTVALATAGIAVFRDRAAEARERAATARERAAAAREAAERSLRDRDIGSFELFLEPFDWDPVAQIATPVPAANLPDLAWELVTDEDDQPGPPFRPEHLTRDGNHVEARGGSAFLLVTHRGAGGETCARSEIPIKALPGYAQRGVPHTLRIPVPTCAASHADAIPIPAGPFILGGVGVPPVPFFLQNPSYVLPQHVVDLAAYAIDRTEVTNAQFAIFAKAPTGVAMPVYPNTNAFHNAKAPNRPVGNQVWSEARKFCGMFGKRLPTSEQWVKALRGGLTIGGVVNPHPRRTFPWGITAPPSALVASPTSTTRPVGSMAIDRSPYDVMDLASNVSEWTRSVPRDEPPTSSMRVTRGANAIDSEKFADFADMVAIDNQRSVDWRNFALGFRCVSE